MDCSTTTLFQQQQQPSPIHSSSCKVHRWETTEEEENSSNACDVVASKSQKRWHDDDASASSECHLMKAFINGGMTFIVTICRIFATFDDDSYQDRLRKGKRLNIQDFSFTGKYANPTVALGFVTCLKLSSCNRWLRDNLRNCKILPLSLGRDYTVWSGIHPCYSFASLNPFIREHELQIDNDHIHDPESYCHNDDEEEEEPRPRFLSSTSGPFELSHTERTRSDALDLFPFRDDMEPSFVEDDDDDLFQPRVNPAFGSFLENSAKSFHPYHRWLMFLVYTNDDRIKSTTVYDTDDAAFLLPRYHRSEYSLYNNKKKTTTIGCDDEKPGKCTPIETLKVAPFWALLYIPQWKVPFEDTLNVLIPGCNLVAIDDDEERNNRRRTSAQFQLVKQNRDKRIKNNESSETTTTTTEAASSSEPRQEKDLRFQKPLSRVSILTTFSKYYKPEGIRWVIDQIMDMYDRYFHVRIYPVSQYADKEGPHDVHSNQIPKDLYDKERSAKMPARDFMLLRRLLHAAIFIAMAQDDTQLYKKAYQLERIMTIYINSGGTHEHEEFPGDPTAFKSKSDLIKYRRSFIREKQDIVPPFPLPYYKNTRPTFDLHLKFAIRCNARSILQVFLESISVMHRSIVSRNNDQRQMIEERIRQRRSKSSSSRNESDLLSGMDDGEKEND